MTARHPGLELLHRSSCFGLSQRHPACGPCRRPAPQGTRRAKRSPSPSLPSTGLEDSEGEDREDTMCLGARALT
ncbi:unnamed protein product [Effrenium voratum]|nr:unnamed protein product [Effrenium voratum]